VGQNIDDKASNLTKIDVDVTCGASSTTCKCKSNRPATSRGRPPRTGRGRSRVKSRRRGAVGRWRRA
jgi:hypothetical protein